ncbi:class III lanthionine synthetase LanKC [Streptomyces sp. WSLK1-3]|uniref:class III lanthionine synthetase LanKC n=1 Tax=Streptomyces sp. WSLK1-3 TaxID=3375475 RepID=UPI0037BDDD3B
MQSWEELYFYSQYDSRWFESPARYQPSPEFLDLYQRLAPADWNVRRDGIWYGASPSHIQLPRQGWKIHVSVRPQDALNCFERALPLLFDSSTPFKFLVDTKTVTSVNGKLWPRQSGGKCITIYPPNPKEFTRLGNRLKEELLDFTGPYILSDRRWPGSSCVHYRYGGFQPVSVLQIDGSRRFVIRDPDGGYVTDTRHPYWAPPQWVTDPLVSPEPNEHEEHGSNPTLLNGRFAVTSALTFTNRGGVYLADDLATNTTVVIKEARPGVVIGKHAIDSVELVRKEYRILGQLSDCKLFVNPVTMFEDRGHAFLVEDFIPGEHLGRFTIRSNPLYHGNITRTSLHEYYSSTRRLWLQIAQAIDFSHTNGIVIGDISYGNIMLTDDDRAICLVDLECATEEGIDQPVGLHTPGLATGQAVREGVNDRASDVYALGAIMFGSIMLANGVSELHPPSLRRFLSDLVEDLGLSNRFIDLIVHLMSESSAGRVPDMKGVISEIEEMPILQEGPSNPRLVKPSHRPTDQSPTDPIEPVPDGSHRALALAARTAGFSYVVNTADLQREDRLFPADPAVFETNPLSISHGAAGVLHALYYAGRPIPQPFLAWLLSHDVGNDRYPPGLYMGQAGIAWVLQELGHPEEGVELLRRARRHELLHTSPNIMHGDSGYGLACLKFWAAGLGEEFLSEAEQIGRHLIGSCRHGTEGIYWVDSSGDVPIGYAFGSSGVSLFLLYLSQAIKDEQIFEAGRAALNHDLGYAMHNGGEFLGFPALAPEDAELGRVVARCYWDHGSAGILTPLVRYLSVNPDQALSHWFGQLTENISHKYAVFPQMFHGLAGMGNALLDAWYFTHDPQYRKAAWRVAEGVLLFRVDRPEGAGFPGEQAMRESSDFATGTAGVALFLDRLIKSDTGFPENFNFVVDELLSSFQPPASAGQLA